jgi:coenzyme F420-reducing hydrogenase alpha subunit
MNNANKRSEGGGQTLAVERTIRVQALARVEGEGAFRLSIRDGHVQDVRLDIFEPPRFFEAFLRGRDFREVPDIVARICGICPVAYQMSCCHALEKALGVYEQVTPAIRALRNLFYCGEWIESHTLHMFMLHLPDFLGYESVISMAADHRDLVTRSLRIKKAGNAILQMQGGRAVHPVGACVGGFYRAPDEQQIARLLPELRACRDDMAEISLKLARDISFPAWERDYEFVALCPDDEYPMNLGRIRSNRGLDLDQEEFDDAIHEHQVPHSTALHARIAGRGAYLVGPLARLNLNAERLHPLAAELLPPMTEAVGKRLPWRSNYFSLLARGLEVVHALALAVDLLEAYVVPAQTYIPITPRAGVGGHGTEAPRGLCWHRYQTDQDGTITAARIIPPTSQNQAVIEQDLLALGPEILELPEEDAKLRCEHLIRNYDPCISCSVH